MEKSQHLTLSEHELRVRSSLEKLNVPDWYLKYKREPSSASGSFVLRKGSADPGGGGLGVGTGGWTGLKASSLTSLKGSNSGLGVGSGGGGGTGTRASVRSNTSSSSSYLSTRYHTNYSGYSSVGNTKPPSAYYYYQQRSISATTSPYYTPTSPASISPSPSPVCGFSAANQGLTSSRFYLGWRAAAAASAAGTGERQQFNSATLYKSSHERLVEDLLMKKKELTKKSESESSLVSTGTTNTTATTTSDEELGGGLDQSNNAVGVGAGAAMQQQKMKKRHHHEISNSATRKLIREHRKREKLRSSIKEVSNAIVSYVNETGEPATTTTKPNFIWLESSFVGCKPLDSPITTPTTMTELNTFNRKTSSRTSSRSNSTNKRIRPQQQQQQQQGEQQQQEQRSEAIELTTVVLTGEPRSSTKKDTSAFARIESIEYCTPFTLENGRSMKSTVVKNPWSPSPQVESSRPTTIQQSAAVQQQQHPSQSAQQQRQPSQSAQQQQQPSQSAQQQQQQRTGQSIEESTTSPTLEDILDSLLAIRRPGQQHVSRRKVSPTATTADQTQQMTPLESVESTSAVEQDWTPDFSQFAQPIYTEVSSPPYQPAVVKHDQSPTFTEQFSAPFDPDQVYSSDHLIVATTTAATTEPSNETNHQHNLHQTDPAAVAVADADEFLRELEDSIAVKTVNVGVVTTTTAKQRRVSFDLDVDDKSGGGGRKSRSSGAGVTTGDEVGTIHCKNTKCTHSATTLTERRDFKTCHNCNVLYCSRECRRLHWDKHKKQCMQSRVGALCKQIINYIKDNSNIVSQLSVVAKRGHLSSGRGCVKLFFSSPDRVERFLSNNGELLGEPWYLSLNNILPEELGSTSYTELISLIQDYNPDTRFILYISVCIVNEIPTSGAVRWEREMISRSSKLHLLLPRGFDPATIIQPITTMTTRATDTTTTTTNQQPYLISSISLSREINFNHVLSELESNFGMHLESEFTQVYCKLLSWRSEGGNNGESNEQQVQKGASNTTTIGGFHEVIYYKGRKIVIRLD